MPAVLLIEDNPDHQRIVSRALGDADEPMEVVTAGSGRAGLRRLGEQRFDCVVLDYDLPDANGLCCLRAIREAYARLPVVMLTGFGSEDVVLEALRLGATHYVPKRGAYLRDLLRLVLDLVRPVDDGGSVPRAGPRLAWEARERFRREGILGDGSPLEDALCLAERAAHSRATVLLEGETGTGKDLVARAIHAHGPRARGPFRTLNCAALPEPLLESELFGCVPGAFTGAERRPGLFRAAHGGTLFLDEVTEMPATTQAKLLRVLQDGMIRPLGSDEERPVEVRVIAATNRDPLFYIQLGQFREDLYYRLHVLPIRMPPLRERRRDIAVLASAFLHRLAVQEDRSQLERIDARALRLLEAYPWPGNVRELESEIHRIVVTAPHDLRVVSAELLAPRLSSAGPSADDGHAPLQTMLDQHTRQILIERLRENNGSRQRTAESLGISREWLWTLMKRHDVKLPPRG